jgi:hypothetical protein
MMKEISETDISTTICEACKDTLFNVESFRKAWDPTGNFTYSTNWQQIQKSQNKGCSWYDFVCDKIGGDLATMDDPSHREYQGTQDSVEANARKIRKEEMLITVSFKNERTDSGNESLLYLLYENLETGDGLGMRVIPICTTSGMYAMPGLGHASVLSRERDNAVQSLDNQPPYPFSSFIFYLYSFSAFKALRILILTYLTPDDHAAQIIPIRPMVLEMTSPITFQLARDCFEQCYHHAEGHENCPPYTATTLPTQVLDV